MLYRQRLPSSWRTRAGRVKGRKLMRLMGKVLRTAMRNPQWMKKRVLRVTKMRRRRISQSGNAGGGNVRASLFR